MKKILRNLLFLTLAITLVFASNIMSVSALPDYQTNVVINNHKVKNNLHHQPFLMGGTSYVPIEYFSTTLDVEVDVNRNALIVQNEDNHHETEIIFNVEDNPYLYSVDGVLYAATTPTTVKSSRLCIPARTLAPLFAMNLKYDDKTNSIVLDSTIHNYFYYNFGK